MATIKSKKKAATPKMLCRSNQIEEKGKEKSSSRKEMDQVLG